MPSTSRCRRAGHATSTLGLALVALALWLALAACGAGAARGGAAPAAAPARARAAVIGGIPAAAGTFPSVADILDVRGRMIGQCSGSVIAPTLILTAGHCVENLRTGAPNPAAGYRVLTGSLSWSAATRQISAVSAVLVYDAYDRRADAGDAALLVLSTPTTAPAIALAASSHAAYFRAGEPALLAGWGVTSFGQGAPTEELHSAPTVVQAPTWCRRYAPPFYRRTELCAVDPPAYATGGCSGDSGGPLVARDTESGDLVEIGIAVHVYGRCSTRRPTVYTRVDAIASWAQSWIRAYPPVPPPAPPAPAPTPAPAPAPAG
jgi:secreted trypsin-like serine protease